MMKNKMFLIIVGLFLILLFTACGKENNKGGLLNSREVQKSSSSRTEEKKKFTLGCMALNEPAIQVIKELLEPKGYELEIKLFDGNHLPAVALKEGSIDSLILNHLPWLNTFNKENKTNLIMVEPYIYYSYFAIYSLKYSSIDELPQNAKIAFPGDPTNMDRSLRVLRDCGLITLGKKIGNFYSLLDVEGNPKKITLIETEVTATARSIEDVDAIISFSSTIKMARFDPEKFIYEDKDSINFPTGLVVQPGNREADWVKALTEVVQTKEFKEKFNEIYDGAYKLFND